MASSSQDYTTTEVAISYSHGDGSAHTLRVSISARESLNDSDDDAEAFADALGVLQQKTVNLVEFLNRHPGCTQYYFEYSSEDYIEQYEERASLGEDEIGAEFGIALEITSGCATKMVIRTTDNDLTVPLHFKQANHPLDAKAIVIFVINAVTHGINPSTAASQGTTLQALSRFGRERETRERPFSLTMLADLEQTEAGELWVQEFCGAPETGTGYRQNANSAVKAFRTGHAQAREQDPLDLAAIVAFMITAVTHGTLPSTAGNQAAPLQALSRFGRERETRERPFSLTMLADAKQTEAADRWVQEFRDAPETGKSYKQHVNGAVQAFRTGYVQAQEDDPLDPLDAEAIVAFVINALKHGTNPRTAGNQASLLQALSRFGRERETRERPFSLTMLADVKQTEAADRWVQEFRDAPETGKAYQQHVNGAVQAFCTGHVQAREQNPIDAAVVTAFMITALKHGANVSTAGNQAASLQALSRFGRQRETRERPFSLSMLADPEQTAAADLWVQEFRDASETRKSNRRKLPIAVKALRTEHAQAGQMANLNVLPIR
jgi:hypothetical protein